MDDTQLFDDLDLSVESNAVAALEDLLSALNVKMQEITTVGQISRSQAKQLVEQFAVSFESTSPIQSFTQTPSTTNLSVAQEGIIATIGEKVWELIKAAGELIKRIFKWIVDFITFRKMRDRQAREVAENVVATHKAAEELRRKANIQPSDSVLDFASKDFDELYNGLIEDFLSEGKYLKFTRGIQVAAGDALDGIGRNREEINRILDTIVKPNHDTMRLLNRVKYMFSSTALRSYTQHLKAAGIPKPNNPDSAREWMQSALIEITKVSMAKPKPMDTTIVMQAFAQDVNAIREPIVLLPDVLMKAVDTDLAELNKLKMAKLDWITAEDQAILQKVTQVTIDDTMSVQIIFSILNLVGTQRDRLMAAMWKYSRYVYESLYNEAMTIDDPLLQRMIEQNKELLKNRLIRRNREIRP